MGKSKGTKDGSEAGQTHHVSLGPPQDRSRPARQMGKSEGQESGLNFPPV
jgi:hypothetical protein